MASVNLPPESMPIAQTAASRFVGLGWLAATAGLVGTMLLGTTHASESYAGMWLVGLPALPFLLLFGRMVERLTLIGLAAITLTKSGDMLSQGWRQIVFIAVFMLFARYLVVRPLVAVLIFMVGQLIYLQRLGEISAVFSVTPTVALLMAAIGIELQARNEGRRLSGWERAKIGLLSAVSLVFPFIGSGSRTALIAWVAFAIRRMSLGLLLVALMGAIIVSQIPGLLIVSKLQTGISELTNPVPESGLGISMRAIEGLIFLDWWQDVGWIERLFGSAEMINMPGEMIGRETDPPFVPHNALAGMIFQFGLVGILLIAVYFRALWRHQAAVAPARFLFFILLIPGFIVTGGFVTVDYAVLAAIVNGMMIRHGARRA